MAGRVSHFLPNWKVLTQDQWVLHIVAGYQLDLISSPCQVDMSQHIQTTTENLTLTTAEVAELLSKGAIVETQLYPDNYVSKVFQVEKRWRSVVGDQPKGAQSVCGARALQDGGPPLSPRPTPARRLDSKVRPEGCIPSGPNPPKPSTTSHLPLGGEKLQIHMPTIEFAVI